MLLDANAITVVPAMQILPEQKIHAVAYRRANFRRCLFARGQRGDATEYHSRTQRDTQGQNGDSWTAKTTKARLVRSGFRSAKLLICLGFLAEWTGLEPATPGVTG